MTANDRGCCSSDQLARLSASPKPEIHNFAAAPEAIMNLSPGVFGIPAEYLIFGVTLAGVALLHRHALAVALAGLAALMAYVVVLNGLTPGVQHLLSHFSGQYVVLLNLLLLLLGFAVLASHFEASNAPDLVPALLPQGWLGGFSLLLLVAGLSVFLDNIAGATIGGIMARHLYQGRVGIGFLAAIVAASNAGGAGSVIGDTTTTMIWVHGISPRYVATAFIGAAVALVTFGIPAAIRQQSFQPTRTASPRAETLDWTRLAIVAVMLMAIFLANAIGNSFFPHLENAVPALGLALWIAIIVTSPVRRPDWQAVRHALTGAVFLIALVASATLLPLGQLPSPSWPTVLGLGFLSAVLDNIPLTGLALRQGGYDWGLVAYAVGFGGSMLWFGSSAGVALAAQYPECRSVLKWLREGWAVPCAYVLGFFVMLMLVGWNPPGP
jgi:Na+/H+ antiporter NhaD/arsenite permease-like protein